MDYLETLTWISVGVLTSFSFSDAVVQVDTVINQQDGRGEISMRLKKE